MTKSTSTFFSKIPVFRQLIQKFAKTDVRLFEAERDLRLLSAEMYFPRLGSNLLSLVSCMKPQSVVGHEKIRIGKDGDGGYVMLNDFGSVSGAYSLGIADEVSWDLEMAKRGIRVEQFDYSIDRSPVENPLFVFSKKKIETTKDILREPQKGRILKIDIEGSEWNFFEQASVEEMKSFVQIVGEFHYFSLYYKPDWQAKALRALQKLSQTHQLIHIHGNNGGEVFWADHQPFPDLIELSFVLRSEYQFQEAKESFPGSHDSPNLPAKADIALDPILKWTA